MGCRKVQVSFWGEGQVRGWKVLSSLSLSSLNVGSSHDNARLGTDNAISASAASCGACALQSLEGLLALPE